jgi:hypothetical protein
MKTKRSKRSNRPTFSSIAYTYIRPADGKCQECGNVDELRPYGKGGKFVCFPCGMKDEDEAKRRFGAILNAGPVIIDARRNR